jgi:hypothetical protein
MPTLTLAKPHAAQQQVIDEAARFNVVACGRRWGKTQLCLEHIALAAALDGHPAGWFAPTYKLLDEAWAMTMELIQPIGQACQVSKQERTIRLPTGGRLDFWTLASSTAERSQAGRGRKYAVAVVDEAAHAPYLEVDWTKSIRPTLSDLRGAAWFPSTPWGHNYFHELWTKGQDPGDTAWASWQMPTARNPFIADEEVEAARLELPADAFAQEYLAEFLADAANPFGVSAIRACVDDALSSQRVVCWGIDLAKSHDWTAAVALDDSGRVAGFQRWQSDWRNTAARVAAMVAHTPALIDSTGVGDPIVELIQQRCSLAEGFKFTSHSKQQLMEGLAMAIQRRQVAFPDGVIRHELEKFRYEYLPSGAVRYTAPEGSHDDCVDALALAVRCLHHGRVTINLDVGDDPTEDERWFRDPMMNEAIWDRQ